MSTPYRQAADREENPPSARPCNICRPFQGGFRAGSRRNGEKEWYCSKCGDRWLDAVDLHVERAQKAARFAYRFAVFSVIFSTLNLIFQVVSILLRHR